MEWLFFVTKSSFMSVLSFFEKLRILFITPTPIVLISVSILFLFWIPSVFVESRSLKKICLVTAYVIPAVILAASFFLLIDNFTYIVFGFGVILTVGILKYAYGFLIFALVIFSYCLLNKFKYFSDMLALVTTVCFIISVAVSFVTFSNPDVLGNNYKFSTIPSSNRPNIFFLASDGLNAENMSVYGYHRDTTPFMRELAKQSLFCENCFTNAGPTGASISSTFTGRLPTQTRLVFPPDILREKDVYVHLPGILKKEGYRNIDLSIRHYADSYDLNLRNSFNSANFREIEKGSFLEFVCSWFGQEPSYFLDIMFDRINERFLHVLGVRNMDNVYAQMVKAEKKYYGDSERIKELFSFIDQSPVPFFAHVHLLGTHGPMFHPDKRVFSKGQKQEKPWIKDFYDDAILHFDHQVEGIIKALRERGLLENTLVVIRTDHAENHSVDKRIPLFFLFPGNEYNRRISSNVQNLDIASTVLDYLDIDQPDRMGGVSLISSKIDPGRYIITVDRKHGQGLAIKKEGGWQFNKTSIEPPFYSLGSVGVVFYHKLFKLDLKNSLLTVFNIKGHTAPCSNEIIPEPKQIGQFIIDHLAENNYDVSSIKIPLSTQYNKKD